jgi:hypothetical protein
VADVASTLDRRRALEAASFAGCALVGGAVLTIWFGLAYALTALAVAAAFIAVDIVHHRRGGRLIGAGSSPTRQFVVIEVGLTIAILVVGSALGAWILAEVGARLGPPFSLPGALLALTTAGATSYAAVAWVNRRD